MSTASLTMRTASESPTSSETGAITEKLTLTGIRPNYLHLKNSATTAAQQATGPGVFGFMGGGALDEEVAKRVERLEEKGVRFERRGRFLFWLGDWKESKTSKTEKYVRKEMNERLRARRPDGMPVEVQGIQDLRELDAFYGSDTPQELPQGELALLLSEMDRNGINFESGSHYRYGSDVGPYGAYNFLTDDKESTEGMTAKVGEQSWQLEKPEDAYLAAYLGGVIATEGLERPEQAQMLKKVASSGLEFSTGNAFDSYKKLAGEVALEEVKISYKDAEVASLSEEALADPTTFYRGLNEQKKRVEGYERLFGDRFLEAWASVEDHQSEESFADRTHLISQLYSAGVEKPDQLYAAILSGSEPGQLQAKTEAALALAAALEAPTGENASLAFQKSVGTSDFDAYTRILGWTQDGESAAQAMGLVGGASSDQAPLYEEFLRRALDNPEVTPELAIKSLEGLHGEQSFMEDAGMVLALLGATAEQDQVLGSYEHIRNEIGEPEREAFVSVFEQTPNLEQVKEAWELFEGDVPAAATAWVALHQACGENEPYRTANEAYQLLKGPEQARHLAILLKVNEGDLETAQKQWTEVDESPEPEMLYALIEGTGSYSEGHAARNHLTAIADQRPLAQRQSALLHLLKGHDQDLGEAIRDYRYLTAVASGDLEAAANTYRQLLETTSQTEAKLAMAALFAAPPQAGSDTSAESLTRALKAVGSFGHARPVWESLEEPGADRSQRVKLLGQVGELFHGRTAAQAYQGLLQTDWTPQVESALKSLSSQLGRTEIRPSGDWATTHLPGKGQVWTDSPGRNYETNSDTSLTTSLVDLSGLKGSAARFQLKNDFATKGDGLLLEARRPGGEWAQMGHWQGQEEWRSMDVDLSDFDDGPMEMRFRLYSDQYATGQGVEIHDLKVDGIKALMGNPIHWTSQKSWGRTEDNGRQVWADSPGGQYENHADHSLVSSPIQFGSMGSPRLVFEQRHDTESNCDFCYLDISDGGNWRTLARFEGQSDWSSQVVALPLDADPQPKLRFRLTSDHSATREGFFLGDATLVDAEDPRMGKTVAFGDQAGWQVEALLDQTFAPDLPDDQRAVAIQQTADAVEEIGVERALGIWPELKNYLGEAEVEDHRLALGALFDLEQPELLAEHFEVVKQSRLAGEKLVDVARVLKSVGPEEFPSVRRLLLDSSPSRAGLGGHTAFLSKILSQGPDQALESWTLVAVPVGDEPVEERREAFLTMVEAHAGDVADATTAYQKLSEWINPNETIVDRAEAYGDILFSLNGDTAKAREAVEFITGHQMKGALSKTDFKTAAQRLTSTLLLRQDQELEPALQATLIDDGAIGEIEFDEEAVVVGDFAVDRND